ncbi:hypothetical protein H4R19_000111 [Coemansia spiralis]|nr:hypothetical protein H4R19_000111 [Coemansia spiralis]
MKGDGSSGMAVFEELLQHYEGRIGALRQARESLELARPAGAAGGAARSRAALGLALFQEMVDELAMGAVFETHSEARQGAALCMLCNTQCQGGGCNVLLLPPPPPLAGLAGPGADAFECQSCQRAFPAARFASHMDKCMGLSSRRAATRSRSAANSAASTPVQGAGSYDSSSEHSADRRRRLAQRGRAARDE